MSPYLSFCVPKFLGLAVGRDKLIQGILSNECDVGQYADDTTLILNGTRSSTERSFSELFDISVAKLSGLIVNYGKNAAFWIEKRTDKLAKKISSRLKVKALAVWFSTSEEEPVILNYLEKKRENLYIYARLLNCWQFKRLNLLSKITVIKSLAASQLYHVTFALLTLFKRNTSITWSNVTNLHKSSE